MKRDGSALVALIALALCLLSLLITTGGVIYVVTEMSKLRREMSTQAETKSNMLTKAVNRAAAALEKLK